MESTTESTTVELKYPIRADGTEVRSLRLRRPKVRDQLAAAAFNKNATDEEKEVRMFANLCEMTLENIEDLDIEDYRKLTKAYRDFFQQEESQQ